MELQVTDNEMSNTTFEDVLAFMDFTGYDDSIASTPAVVMTEAEVELV